VLLFAPLFFLQCWQALVVSLNWNLVLANLHFNLACVCGVLFTEPWLVGHLCCNGQFKGSISLQVILVCSFHISLLIFWKLKLSVVVQEKILLRPWGFIINFYTLIVALIYSDSSFLTKMWLFWKNKNDCQIELVDFPKNGQNIYINQTMPPINFNKR
jgi:hypothetical protein